MTKQETALFVIAGLALQPAHNPGERRERAEDAKATAEELVKLFDVTGLFDEAGGTPASDDATRELFAANEERQALRGQLFEANAKLAHLESIGVTKARLDELEQLGATNAKRIADLEAELAAAKAGKAARR